MNARHDHLPAGPTAAPLTSRGGRTDPRLASQERSTALPLGSVVIDGRAVELVWLTRSDSILVDFTEVEPKRIGTVVMREDGPGFVAQPGHLDWLRYLDREARLLHAACRLRSRRV